LYAQNDIKLQPAKLTTVLLVTVKSLAVCVSQCVWFVWQRWKLNDRSLISKPALRDLLHGHHTAASSSRSPSVELMSRRTSQKQGLLTTCYTQTC